MTAQEGGTVYRMPRHAEDTGRETAWFFRMNSFQREHTARQVRFRNEHLDFHAGDAAAGSYPHILPRQSDGRADLSQAVYGGIAPEVQSYLDARGVQWDAAVSDMCSSRACSLNFLFPWRQDPEAARQALRPILPGVREVRRIEFDFAGSLDRGSTAAAEWLGEPTSASSRADRTGVDAAIWWTDAEGPRVTFTEWKYTDCGLGKCPGLESCLRRGRNIWIRRCTEFHTAAIPQDAEHRCYMSSGETSRVSRRYWERMEDAGVDVRGVGPRAAGCVFRGPFHRLMRQWLLAEYVRRAADDGRARVDVCLVHFAGNKPLFALPGWMREMGKDLPSAWRTIVTRPADYRTCSVEELMQACDEGSERPDPNWRDYVRERYGV